MRFWVCSAINHVRYLKRTWKLNSCFKHLAKENQSGGRLQDYKTYKKYHFGAFNIIVFWKAMRECLSKYTFCFNSTCCFIFTPQSIFQVPVVSFCLPGLTLHIKNCLEGVWSTIWQGVKHVLSWLGACHDRTDRSTYCDTLKAGSTSPHTSQTFLIRE